MNTYGSANWVPEHQVATHRNNNNNNNNNIPMKLDSMQPQPPRSRPSSYVQRNLGRFTVLTMPTRTDNIISGAKWIAGFATSTHPVQLWLMAWYSIWLRGNPLLWAAMHPTKPRPCFDSCPKPMTPTWTRTGGDSRSTVPWALRRQCRRRTTGGRLPN